MLHIVKLIFALFFVMQLSNFAHAQITTSVAATPTEKICAIGSENVFDVTGNCTANGVQGQESIQNCQWQYVGATAYSDETCNTEDPTIVSATTEADSEWVTQKTYTKKVTIKGLNVGTSWVKFRMKYRLDNTSDGTDVISITPVKITVKNITLTAPRWLKKGDEETIEIAYDTDAFTDGSIELSGLSDLYDVIDSDFVAGVTNSATVNPTDGKLSWVLAGRSGTKAGKITVKVKGKNPKESTLTAKHTTSSAKDEKDVGVFNVDVILGGIGEGEEESPGVFFASAKRATLELKAEPKSAGETATLSLTGLDLYNSETGGEKNTKRTWNLVNEDFPASLYVGGTTSSNMRDKEVKLTWKSKNDTAKGTAVEVYVKIGSLEEQNDKKAYLRYCDPMPSPQPAKSKRTITFAYFPPDLNVGKLVPTFNDNLKLLDGEDNEIISTTGWDLTSESWCQTGVAEDSDGNPITVSNAAKDFYGIANSLPDSGEIEVFLEHKNTGAEDKGCLYVCQFKLATNTKVLDPKLSGTTTIESIITCPDMTSEVNVLDGTNTVNILTRNAPATSTTPNTSKNSDWSWSWDGKWKSINDGKFADPKKYTIKAILRDTANNEIDSESVDVYVVRLGIGKIEFEAASGTYVPMQFHTTQADINTGQSTSATKWAYSIPWQLSSKGITLNVDTSDGLAALEEDSIYKETFYPKMTTETTPVRSTYYNYPICYVKGSTIKIMPTPSNNYVSHLTGGAATGTIPTDTPDIFMKIQRKKTIASLDDDEYEIQYGIEKETDDKITVGTKVEFNMDEVQNKVGNETLEFEYSWFYKDGSTKITIPGTFTSNHKCYTIIDTPHAPWGISSGEKPWLAVVDVATSGNMAGGITLTSTGLKPLYTRMEKAINELEGNIGGQASKLSYDITSGAQNYAESNSHLRMANFMLFLRNDSNVQNSRLVWWQTFGGTTVYKSPNTINCRDCALLLAVFTNIVGGNLRVGIIEDNYVLNPINPIGLDQFMSIGLLQSGGFNFHAVTVHASGATTPPNDAEVYDACLKLGIPDPTKNANGVNATSTNCKLSAGLPFDIPNNLSLSSVMGNEAGKLNCNPILGITPDIFGINAKFEIAINADTTTYTLKKDNIELTNSHNITTTRSQDGINIIFTTGTRTAGTTFSFDTIYNYNEYKSSLSTPGTAGRGSCNWSNQIQVSTVD
ncbi:MAG: hypothetical protein LBK82_16485 [Planctomycetaceae bacterium]|jgi:hypothetical protein|nr:hypothetical protein [Planctomycetaceae bacterium]